ncbi:MAG: hypothetical protein A2020_12345 [Lentisphaerae bacterium GWF2_45_14]|nr:MAG: hypothetical protein A2020_12345 [Lentisphaerae bacterium GWF2_45_14]
MSKLDKMQLNRVESSLAEIMVESLKKIEATAIPKPEIEDAIKEAKRKPAIFTQKAMEAYSEGKRSYDSASIETALLNMPEYQAKIATAEKSTQAIKKRTAVIREKFLSEIRRIMDALYLGKGDAIQMIEGFKQFCAKGIK